MGASLDSDTDGMPEYLPASRSILRFGEADSIRLPDTSDCQSHASGRYFVTTFADEQADVQLVETTFAG
jgi:hypothetical protein